MEKYCKSCGRVFDDLNFKICPYCGGELATRYGRQPIPRKLRHEVFKRDGYRCRECGASRDETSLEIDHIVPIARGGTNDIDNLQTLCRECNRMKHTDEWIGGEDTVEVAQNELNNLENQLYGAKRKLEQASNDEDILDYKFKIKKLSSHLIPEAQIKLDNLIYEAEATETKRQTQLNENKRKDRLFKELYVEFDEEILSRIYTYLKLNESSNEENLRLLVDEYSRDEIYNAINLVQVEKSSALIDNLDGHHILIFLKDGSTLTNWDEVLNKEDIVHIIEDISNFTNLDSKYENLKSLRSITTLGTTNQVTTMENMFAGCESLVDITSLSKWDVSNVKNMSGMFYECKSLVDISSLANWDVSNVTDMACLFMNCESLIDVSSLASWEVSNVENMWGLFECCYSLKNINALSSWNVSSVSTMYLMFCCCESLKDISSLANWDVSNVTSLGPLFEGCKSLNDVSALSNWDVSNVEDMEELFCDCENLIDISALSDWNVINVNNMNSMFRGCVSLMNLIPLNKWNVLKSCDTGRMFDNMVNLKNYPYWYSEKGIF